MVLLFPVLPLLADPAQPFCGARIGTPQLNGYFFELVNKLHDLLVYAKFLSFRKQNSVS
jgi:hypothetical protein